MTLLISIHFVAEDIVISETIGNTQGATKMQYLEPSQWKCPKWQLEKGDIHWNVVAAVADIHEIHFVIDAPEKTR